MAIRKPLVIVAGQKQELPAGDTIVAVDATVSNVISSPTTIAADTSYIVASYLKVDSDLTINGNLMVIG